MLRNVARYGILLKRDSYVHSQGTFIPSACAVFKREASNRPQATVADDANPETRHNDGLHRLPSVKVLFDGECNICMHEINLLKTVARKRPVEFIDINTDTFTAENFSGVTYEMAMKEMHVIGADGKVHVQGDAVREMYRACGLGWLSMATQMPGVKEVCDTMYMKYAQYRLEKALDRCDSGVSCSIKLKHLRDKLRTHQK